MLSMPRQVTAHPVPRAGYLDVPHLIGNPNPLIPGGFTYPSRSGGTLGTWTIKVHYGDAKSWIDFGWEFQHLG